MTSSLDMTRLSTRRGFTLMETVIAISIVAILLTTFVAAFGPATTSLRRSMNSKVAERLSAALEAEMNTLNSEEDHDIFKPLQGGSTNQHSSAFEKAISILSTGSSALKDAPDDFIVAYEYKARIGSTGNAGDDGRPVAFSGTTTAVPGKDYELVPSIRPQSNLSSTEIAAVEGRVYYVRLEQLQLRSDSDGLSLVKADEEGVFNPGSGASGGQEISNSADYLSGSLVVLAELYDLPTNDFTFLNGGGAETYIKDRIHGQESTIKPVYSYKFAVVR